MSGDTFNISIKFNITDDNVIFTSTCKKCNKSKIIKKSSCKLNNVLDHIFYYLKLDYTNYNLNYDNCIIDVIIKNKELEVINIYPHKFSFITNRDMSNPTKVSIFGNIYNCNNIEFVKAYNEFIKSCKKYAEKNKTKLFIKKKLHVKMKAYDYESDNLCDGFAVGDDFW